MWGGAAAGVGGGGGWAPPPPTHDSGAQRTRSDVGERSAAKGKAGRSSAFARAGRRSPQRFPAAGVATWGRGRGEGDTVRSRPLESHRVRASRRSANSRGSTTRPAKSFRAKSRRSPVTSTADASVARSTQRCSSPCKGPFRASLSPKTAPLETMSVRRRSISAGERPCRERIRGRQRTARYSAMRSSDSRYRNRARIRTVGEASSPVRTPLTTTLVSMTAGGGFIRGGAPSFPEPRAASPRIPSCEPVPERVPRGRLPRESS